MIARLFVDDATRQDHRARINTEKLGRMTDITEGRLRIEATGDNLLTIFRGCAIALETGGFFVVESEIIIGAANLDTGSAFIVGRDYYIYLCDSGSLADGGRIVISLNATFPTGWNPISSRKIGGFHFGVCRRVNNALQPINNANAIRGDNWEANVFNGIVPRSVWTISHRPKCNPEGMVYLAAGVWVDIYLASDDGAGGLLSRNNATPITGTEGLNCYAFIERMLVSGKRLLTYNEFIQAAMGSPQGLAGDNTNAHTGATARALTGSVQRAVSSVGCRDCVGNVWEWTSDIIASGIQNAPATTGAWRNPMPDLGFGQLWLWNENDFRAPLAGGNWSFGVHAGARTVVVNNSPWTVNTTVGARGACDSL